MTLETVYHCLYTRQFSFDMIIYTFCNNIKYIFLQSPRSKGKHFQISKKLYILVLSSLRFTSTESSLKNFEKSAHSIHEPFQNLLCKLRNEYWSLIPIIIYRLINWVQKFCLSVLSSKLYLQPYE